MRHRSRFTPALLLAASAALATAPALGQACVFGVEASDGAFNDDLGTSIAVSGDWMALGAPGCDTPEEDAGAVYMYQRQGASWVERQILVPAIPYNEGFFGTALALEGDLLVVGAPGDNALITRTAYAFTLQGATWVERTRLDPPAPYIPQGYGRSVAIDGDTIVVGDPTGGANGSVHVFERTSGSFAYLTDIAPALPGVGARFGTSVDLSGQRLAVGAEQLPGPGLWHGGVFVFEGAGANWVETAVLQGEGSFLGDFLEYRFFGKELSLDGDVLFVGTWVSTIQSSVEGHSLVYEHDGGSWNQTEFFAGISGVPVAVQGDRAVVGGIAPNGGTEFSGAVILKERRPSGWVNVAVVSAEAPHDFDGFGLAVALDQDTVAGGADHHQVDGVRVGGGNAVDWNCASDDFATYSCLCRDSAPCGNEDEHAGCSNSTGYGGYLGHSGSPSLALDDLEFTMDSLPVGQFGLVYVGTQTTGAPFGDGHRCVGGTVCRLGARSTGAAGSFTTAPSLFGQLQLLGCPLVPGSTLHFQGWYRDPVGPCGGGFNLTNAIAIELEL